MTDGKEAPKRRLWPLLAQASLVGPALVLLVAALNMQIDVTIGFAIFLLLLAGSIVLSFRAMGTYRCPVCEVTVTPPKGWWRRFPGQKILFQCPECGVKWHFGLTGQED